MLLLLAWCCLRLLHFQFQFQSNSGSSGTRKQQTALRSNFEKPFKRPETNESNHNPNFQLDCQYNALLETNRRIKSEIRPLFAVDFAIFIGRNKDKYYKIQLKQLAAR